MRRVFVVLACLLCGPSCDDRVHCAGFAVDENFAPAERAEIADAASRWSAIATARVSLGPYQACRIRRVGSEAQYDLLKASIASPPEDFSGTTDEETGVVWIDPPRSANTERFPSAFLHVAQHEIGHALGLDHVRFGAMSPGWDLVDGRFSEEDLAECARVGVCGSAR